MSVKLRLRRGGKKKHPVYRIVAIDSRKRRDGEYIEKVGFYDPNPEPAVITVDREKAMKWLAQGAIPSDTVRSFFKRDGIMHEWALRKRGLDDSQIAEEMQKWQALQLEKQKKAEAKAAMAKRQEEKTEKETAPEAEAVEEPVVEQETTDPETVAEAPPEVQDEPDGDAVEEPKE